MSKDDTSLLLDLRFLEYLESIYGKNEVRNHVYIDDKNRIIFDDTEQGEHFTSKYSDFLEGKIVPGTPLPKRKVLGLTGRDWLSLACRVANGFAPIFFVTFPGWLLIVSPLLLVPVIGWIVSFALWVWGLFIGGSQNKFYIVLFCMESIYFIYRFIKDRKGK